METYNAGNGRTVTLPDRDRLEYIAERLLDALKHVDSKDKPITVRVWENNLRVALAKAAVK